MMRNWMFALGFWLMACGLAMASPLDEARVLRQQAAAAEKSGDVKSAISAYEQALQIQPGHPVYWLNLAVLEKRLGNDATARNWLQKYAAAGLYFDPGKLATFMDVHRDDPEFSPVFDQLAENGKPHGMVRPVADFDQVDALTESLTVDRNRLYLGTIADGRIWRREDHGPFSVFIDDPVHLTSAFAMVVDHVRGVLWVSSGTVPQSPYRSGAQWKSGLLAYDLHDGKYITGIDMSAETSTLGDMMQAKDGTIYVSDGQSGAIWKFSPDLQQKEKLDTGGQLSSPQGLVAFAGGILIADYSTGLWLWDGTDLHRVRNDVSASLIGLDGLARADDQVIAIQNGSNPRRILSLSLSPDGQKLLDWRVMAQNLPGMEEPTQGVVRQNRFWFIANAQWSRFPENTPENTYGKPREPVHVLAVELKARVSDY